ncbi:MAG: UTP--glucose-1-phosphate uridylyltransferase [Deltaproteobacteria bacterium]|nr:UTP--glucose-1-phosphate uridylyltransferase [Deltaproteobacteria bacterium]
MDGDLASCLGPGQLEALERYWFDPTRLAGHRDRLRTGAALDTNAVRGELRAPAPGDIPTLPPPGSTERQRLGLIGSEAIGRGQVAAVILNGGMATRFGGVVKASVEALPSRSFLDLKLADARASARRAGGHVPVFLMNSFATDEPTGALLAAMGAREVGTFAQSVSLRLSPAGDLFLGKDGLASLYAPGHGDLVDALRRGTLAKLRATGVRALVMSNVDNLAASVDPAIVGFHLDQPANQMTVEVVRKDPGDKGGAPAWLSGRLEVIESFRFPASFDQDSIPVFNTNTFVLDVAALDREFPLDFFAVSKTVDDKKAIQFERLAGQLSAFLATRYLEVPRTGPEGRFLPAKDPEELAARRSQIVEVLTARGVL